MSVHRTWRPPRTWVLAAAALVYWRLGESPGSTTALDSSGNHRDATYGNQMVLAWPGAITSDPDSSALFNLYVNNDALWQPPSGDTHTRPFARTEP